MKIKHIETGEVFEVVKFSGEYWIDDTGYIESDQLGVSWELVDDYKQLYEQQKQRADELEEKWDDLKGHIIARSVACKERRMIRERDALIDVMIAMHDLEGDENGED